MNTDQRNLKITLKDEVRIRGLGKGGKEGSNRRDIYGEEERAKY
jgi:hypothetical protein